MLNYEEAAELLGVHKNTLYGWVHLKKVPHHRYGPRTVRFMRNELEAWRSRHAVAMASDGSVATSVEEVTP